MEFTAYLLFAQLFEPQFINTFSGNNQTYLLRMLENYKKDSIYESRQVALSIYKFVSLLDKALINSILILSQKFPAKMNKHGS
jgi:hypothetical protein